MEAQPFLTRHRIDACFLGPYGENNNLLEKLVVEFLRDHVYWRRNFPIPRIRRPFPPRPRAIRITWRSNRACVASCTSCRHR